MSIRSTTVGLGTGFCLLATVINAQTVTTYPYSEDFEAGPAGYLGTGDWELGSPSTLDISQAVSGVNAWVTNLDGNPSGVDSFLTSPTFDLTSFAHDPMLEFQLIHELDNRAAVLSMSIDGAMYERVGSPDDPGSVNWYGAGQFGIGWQGNLLPWGTARHQLTGAAGHMVVLRWDVVNPPTFREGMGLDDVHIFETPTGTGQAARPGVATLEVGTAVEVGGFPVESARPGPYFSQISVSTEAAAFRFVGEAGQIISLYGGGLFEGLVTLAGIGQVDLAPGFFLVASGNLPGGLNPFFQTQVDGSMTLSVTVPPSLAGSFVTYQAVLTHPTEGLALTNAVHVEFLL